MMSPPNSSRVDVVLWTTKSYY